MSQLVPNGFLTVARDLGTPLDLAGPYLTLGILQELRPRRILVDVEAWAASTRESLTEVYDSLPNSEWRHLERLHAKLAVGPDGALIGSANFTHNGMDGNVELGVRLTDASEASAWFEDRWSWAIPIDRHELDAYESTLPTQTPQASDPRFAPRTALLPPTTRSIQLNADEETRLIRTLQRFPDKQAATCYLALLYRFYSEMGLDPGDPRLSLLPEQSGYQTLRVNVNNRIALTWYRRRESYIGFSVEESFVMSQQAGVPEFGEHLRFNEVGRRPQARHLTLPRPEDLVARSYIWSAVIQWAKRELDYSNTHPGLRRYDPSAGRLVFDRDLQRRLLERAFPHLGNDDFGRSRAPKGGL